MPYRLDIYIGSDNDSKRISKNYLERVRNWADAAFPDGYTLVKCEGMYRGVSEDSILLYALLSREMTLKEHLVRLKRELRQESILVVKSAVDVEVI